MCRFYQTFFPVSEYERASVFVVKDGSESKSQKVNVYIKRRDRDDQERENDYTAFWLIFFVGWVSHVCRQNVYTFCGLEEKEGDRCWLVGILISSLYQLIPIPYVYVSKRFILYQKYIFFSYLYHPRILNQVRCDHFCVGGTLLPPSFVVCLWLSVLYKHLRLGRMR